MAKSSRSKRRNSIEPITVDELLSAAGMSGFVSFLNVKPEDYGRAEPGATVEAEPGGGASRERDADLVTSTVESSTGESSTVYRSIEENSTGEPSTVEGAMVESAGLKRAGLPGQAASVEASIHEASMVEVATVEAATVEAVSAVHSKGTAETGDVASIASATVEAATVEPNTVEAGSPGSTYWTIEGIGGVFPPTRLRPLEKPEDVLTGPEQSVYGVLWSAGREAADHSRRVAMGYEEIARRARASKRGVVDIIQRLIHKGFLEIAQAPVTFRERRPTEYRVMSYAVVAEGQRACNRRWTIRTGNGIGYAQPLAIAFDPYSTIEAGSASTAADGRGSHGRVGES